MQRQCPRRELNQERPSGPHASEWDTAECLQMVQPRANLIREFRLEELERVSQLVNLDLLVAHRRRDHLLRLPQLVGVAPLTARLVDRMHEVAHRERERDGGT